METLHLTLKKKWFDMILSGEKKEEYRETKDFWYERLMHHDIGSKNNIFPFKKYTELKKFETITFKNGYRRDAPEMVVKCNNLEIKKGKPEWGAKEGKTYFVFSLGEVISVKNIEKCT